MHCGRRFGRLSAMKVSKPGSKQAFLATVAGALLAGCTTGGGVYEPGCIAFEGDRVEISGKRFVWDRFTDERRVDAEGREIDLFPDYPKTGRVEVRAGRVRFYPESGDPIERHYLLKRGSATYLLSAEQRASVMSGGDMPDCALRRN